MSYTPTETCRESIVQLSDFLDGELDQALCTKIEQHLAECPYCHTVAETTQMLLALYRSARATVPPEVHTHLLCKSLAVPSIAAQ